MRPLHLMPIVLPCVCVAALLAVAHAQPTLQPAAGISPGGGPGVLQPGPTATMKPVDPVLRDPILLRNCQAEYDQALKSLGGSLMSQAPPGPSGPPNAQQMGGILGQGNMSGRQLGGDAAADAARLEVLRNRALLNKLECKTDQVNRKLDYVLNVNVPRR